jgi:hypothetical protein
LQYAIIITISISISKEEFKMFSSILGFLAKSVFQAVVNVVVGVTVIGYLLSKTINSIGYNTFDNIIEGEVI